MHRYSKSKYHNLLKKLFKQTFWTCTFYIKSSNLLFYDHDYTFFTLYFIHNLSHGFNLIQFVKHKILIDCQNFQKYLSMENIMIVPKIPVIVYNYMS